MIKYKIKYWLLGLNKTVWEFYCYYKHTKLKILSLTFFDYVALLFFYALALKKTKNKKVNLFSLTYWNYVASHIANLENLSNLSRKLLDFITQQNTEELYREDRIEIIERVEGFSARRFSEDFSVADQVEAISLKVGDLFAIEDSKLSLDIDNLNSDKRIFRCVKQPKMLKLKRMDEPVLILEAKVTKYMVVTGADRHIIDDSYPNLTEKNKSDEFADGRDKNGNLYIH